MPAILSGTGQKPVRKGKSIEAINLRRNAGKPHAGFDEGDQVAMHGMRIMSHDGETLTRMYAEA